MSARIVSADEARVLLEGATPGPWHMEHASKAPPGEEWGEVVARLHPAGGAGAPVPGMRLTWSRRSVGVLAERNARLISAAPTLAHTVIALESERDELRTRVARLERVLAVEGGDESQAPEGWRKTDSGRWARGSYRVIRPRHCWALCEVGETWFREFGTALDAMEAADAAEVKP